jgi:hypothetical protein
VTGQRPPGILLAGPLGWNSGPCWPAGPGGLSGPAVSSPGPFETEADARNTPEVQAIYAEWRADPGQRTDAAAARMITEAADAVGIELGGFDRRIIAWVAGFEPTTVAVFAGLITQAAAGRSPGG